MPDYLKKNKEDFSSFTQKRWEKWIWERTHGIDTITDISVVRDSNPHHAIIDSYRTLTNKKQRNKFVDALMSSLHQSLEECQNSPKVEDDNLQLKVELLTLERHLHILNRLDDEDIPSGAVRTSRACYQFVYNELPLNQCNSLRRIALAVRSRVGDRISDLDLRNALNSKDTDTYVVAFRCALKKYSSLAISKFFPPFVEMALQKQKEVFIKVELIQLVESFGQDSGNLRRQLSEALSHLPEEARAIVRKQAREIGFHIPCIKTVEDAIRDRELLIYGDTGYVEGSNYNSLAREVTNYLSEEMSVSAQPSIQGIIWHLIIVDMNENMIDFLYDPYFASDARSLGIDVVQFGWLNTFTCLLHAESEVYKRIKRVIESRKYNFKEQITRSLNAYRSMQIGVLGDTAATSAVKKALHDRSEVVGEVIVPLSSVEELGVWLSDGIQNRIVICDHGIAKQMTKLTVEKIQRRGIDVNAEKFVESWRGVHIPIDVEFIFDEPIRVGFAYPVFDDKWGEVIKKAVRHVILENWVTWEDVKPELEDVGIIAFSEEELCKSLGITWEFKLALEKRQCELEAKVIEQQEMLKKAQDGRREAEQSGMLEEITRLRKEVEALTKRAEESEEKLVKTVSALTVMNQVFKSILSSRITFFRRRIT